ncbi:GlsB/YeaQ/YmgE family stress response membrane protein [Allomeiothermus silvanus]|uniref:GlsB/YeaQ/YmgE family stress response membrane protein n=1 Tax=Allomeiothermus silvanus TaxID=52022 RepID=UPI0023F09543|nr:GlsB/YeaQ/YmgE family stress response membrane protein [Allomeiothermus silvanus]
MSWIVAIIVGAIIGWLASSVMGEREGLVGKIIIGIVGSLLAKWLFADLLHIGGAASAGTFTIAGLIWGVIGAVILIWALRALKVIR